MPHHIYTTPGFLVHSAPHGEAGKFFLVFTRDLGMIGATAAGVRFSQSKLRYYTQDYAYSLFSLVQGKDVWRMTGAKELENRAGMVVGGVRKENLKIWVRVLMLVRRLVPGEEKNEQLYRILEELHGELATRETTKEVREAIEYLTVLRILNSLGYVTTHNLKVYFADEKIPDNLLSEMMLQKDEIVKIINHGLKQSQL